MRPLCLLASAIVTASLVVPTRVATAATVTVPIRLDEAFLRRLIVAQVFTDPGESALLWDDPRGCGELVLSSPEVEANSGRLVVRSTGAAEWGAPVGDVCTLPFTWHGVVEVVERPTLEPGRPVIHFEVADSALYRKDGRRAVIASQFWGWIRGYVEPRMASISVDLAGPVAELREALPLFLPAAYASDASATLASVSLAAVRVQDEALAIDVALTSPDPPAGSVPQAEPPLDVHEVEQWDAFLTFVVKQIADDVSDMSLRTALLAVLLDSRYDVVEALTKATPDARDPVPELFRSAWARLAPTLRDLEGTLPGGVALRYLAFVAAGDALLAIDRLGPGSGLDISAEGLRRLARMVAPEETADPLDYETVVDPDLRESFGFGPPLPLPPSEPASPAPAVSAPATPTTSTTTLPAVAPSAPPVTTPPSSAPTVPPTSSTRPTAQVPGLIARFLDWLVAPADAAEKPSDDERRLRNWAPTRDDVDEYLPVVQRLLHRASDDTLAKEPFDERYTRIFRPLVLATAWKETCWRQFVRRAGKVVTIQSGAGAVGIMQVNPRVWRGFYDASGLRTDPVYNAQAGAEILRHYLVDYAIRKKEHDLGGGIDALARATYAAYNGGPGHLSRYRSEKAAKSLRAIDAEFWTYYQAVKGGNELGVRQCFVP